MIAGIVCEYNPFHNGHRYHIEKTRAAGADHIVCVMSGNFVQRGECALIDKWQRAEQAICGGADLVIDLPVPWAMGSAESFARGSISLLCAVGIDVLSFGSEFEDKDLLYRCADASGNSEVAEKLRKYILSGDSYPLALSKSAGEVYGDGVREILSSPNSTLAVEYLKQLRHFSPECDAFPVKRKGAGHDSGTAEGNFASASRIRELLFSEDVSAFVPDRVSRMLTQNLESGHIHKTENAERAILSALREMGKDEYALYVTDESGLSDRIYEGVRCSGSLAELYEKAKSKNYTHARIRREVMNLYLKIPKEYGKKTPPYIRVLAANDKGLSLLKNAKLPLITKHSDAVFADDFSKSIYELQCSSTDKFALMSERVRPCAMEQTSALKVVSSK